MNKATLHFIFGGGFCLLLCLNACKNTQPLTQSKPQPQAVVSRDSLSQPQPDSEDQEPYRFTQTRQHDLLHTRLALEFDWEQRAVYGQANLTLKPYFYPQDSLVLDAQGFEISLVHLIHQDIEEELDYTYDGRSITIQLGNTYTREQTYEVAIDYIAYPERQASAGSEAIEGTQGLYFINPDGKNPNKPRQIWSQGETSYNSCWFPTIDHPNERSTQELYVTVDPAFKTLSNGELVYSKDNTDGTRTDYWKMDQAHAPYLFTLVVGEYAVVKEEWQGKEVSYYVEPAYEKYAKAIFGNTPEMMSFFSEKLKYPYPWNKYAQVVVRDFVSGAMENTSASTFMEDLQVDDRTLLDESWDYIIAHELFHQWFGDLVTCESWANLPLNEAFANYAEYLWNEYKYGVEEADHSGWEELQGYLEESKLKQEPLIRFHYENAEDMFDAHSYNKGGRVLHMLRNYVGDEAFWEALHLYLKENEYQSAEIHDLRLAFEEVTGEDLNWFFNQWFLAPGHPILEINHTYQAGQLALQVKQKQDLSQYPIFRLPIKIAIWENGSRKIYPITIQQSEELFTFNLENAPDLVVFDADQQLLAETTHPKSQSEWIYQYQHEQKYLARRQALLELQELGLAEVAQVQEQALEDSFWVIRDLAIGIWADSEEPVPKTVEQKILDLAQHDPEAYVRASAVDVLGILPKADRFQEVFLQGTRDRAYSVVESSLYAFWQNSRDQPKIKSLMDSFLESKDPGIILVLAEYYTEQSGAEQYDWLMTKIKEAKSFEKYELIQYLGQQLLKVPAQQQAEGIQVLEEILLGKDPDWAKFSAFQALLLLQKQPEIKALIEKVKAQEKNESLLHLYQSLE